MKALIENIAELLVVRELRLATAESCTGGLVSSMLTDLAGSSQWFECGFVTYSNDAKQMMLGVNETTLEEHGAVSEPVVREMAEGAIEHSLSHVSLSISGIAGPGGGTLEKPVGTVCLGWARQGAWTVSETQHFSGDRDQIRQAAAQRALQRLLELLRT